MACAPAPSKLTILVPGVTVPPLLVQSPNTENVSAAEQLKVPVAPMVMELNVLVPVALVTSSESFRTIGAVPPMIKLNVDSERVPAVTVS